jgi:predicted RNA-binding protein YlxR (DUF448 family)
MTPGEVHSLASDLTGPVRTCIGCRKRVAMSDLLRVVIVNGTVQPDPQRRLPGRGANLHPDHECLAAAERRRAFGRALRVDGPVDLSALRDAISTMQGSTMQGSTMQGSTAKD